MNRLVNYARFHSNLYVPGIGEMGSVLPHPSKTFLGFSLMQDPAGNVTVFANGKEVRINAANVALTVLEPLRAESKSAAA